MSNNQSTPFGDGSFEQTLGDTARTRLLRFLAEADEPKRQLEIAEAVDVSQPMVSRAKQPLVKRGLIDETDDGLILSDEAREVVGVFQQLIEE